MDRHSNIAPSADLSGIQWQSKLLISTIHSLNNIKESLEVAGPVETVGWRALRVIERPAARQSKQRRATTARRPRDPRTVRVVVLGFVRIHQATWCPGAQPSAVHHRDAGRLPTAC